MKKKFLITLFGIFILNASAQQVDYSVVYVPEESGIEFKQITSSTDYVCMPLVARSNSGIDWLSNRIIDISYDGEKIAYLAYRNNTSNIFIKDVNKQGSSVQRTNRSNVLDFSYSPDGKYICFSEARNNVNDIYRTDANVGFICRQITSGNSDYSPIYSSDMSLVFFARQEQQRTSIWSYNIADNFLSNYTTGMNPYPVKGESAYICSRVNNSGKGEIWKINYETGTEESIVSDPNKSFTTPSLSPDGTKLLFVASSVIRSGDISYYNTDIYSCNIDGTNLVQITYHAADDLSPIWSRDGKYIYFISQRGDAEGVANIWRINYNY